MTQKFETFKNLFIEIGDIIGESDHLAPVNGHSFMHNDISDHSEWVKYLDTEDFYNLSDAEKEKVKLFTLIMDGATVVQEHGGEGQGDEYNTVYHFPHLNLFVKFSGWYASHVGAEFQNMWEVEPKEVLITEYHAVRD